MYKQANIFDKGFQDQLAPELQSNNTARSVFNMRITSLGNNSYAIESIKGNKVSFTLPNEKYQPCSYIEFTDRLLIFSTNDNHNNPVGSNGEIGVVFFDEKYESIGYIPLYNHKNLNFCLKNKVHGKAMEENLFIKDGYFWDFRNPPRIFNSADELYYSQIQVSDLVIGNQYMVLIGTVVNGTSVYGPNELSGTVFVADGTEVYNGASVIKYYPVELLDIIPKKACGKIEFVKWITGDLFNGSYVYFYQLEDNNGIRTSWSIGTNPVHLTNNIPSNNYLLPSSESYEGSGAGTGSVPNLNSIKTTKGIKIKISGIDTNYTKIRIAALHTADYNTWDSPEIFYYGNIVGAEQEFEHKSLYNGERIVIEELFSNIEGIEKNKCGAIIRNILILGNYKTRTPIKWNTEASVQSILKCFVADSSNLNFENNVDESASLNFNLAGTFTSKRMNNISNDPFFVFPEMVYEVITGSVKHNGIDYGPLEPAGPYFTAVDEFITVNPSASSPIPDALFSAHNWLGLPLVLSVPPPPFDCIFFTESSDPGNNYTNTTGEYTAPMNGYYTFNARMMFDLTGSSSFKFKIRFNIYDSGGISGGVLLGSIDSPEFNPGSPATVDEQFSDIIYLNKDEVVVCFIVITDLDAIPDNVTMTFDTDSFFEVTNAETDYAELIQCLKIEKYEGVYEYHRIEDDIPNGAGMTVDTYCKSRWRGETYRIGVVLWDNWGNPYETIWIDDYRTPEQSENSLNTAYNTAGTVESAKLIKHKEIDITVDGITLNNRRVYYLKHLGLRVNNLNFNKLIEELESKTGLSLSIADLPKYFKGFSIVCAERDATIIAQGLAYPNLRTNRNSDNAAFVTPMSFDRPWAAIISSYWDQTIRPISGFSPSLGPEAQYDFFSPDMQLRFKDQEYALQRGDEAEIVMYYEDTKRKIAHPEGGTKHTLNYHFYSKFIETVSIGSGYPQPKFRMGIDNEKCTFIEVGEIKALNYTSSVIYENYALMTDVDTQLDSGSDIYSSLGSKKFLLVIGDFRGQIQGLGSGFYNLNKPLVNIRREKTSLYGGQSESALSATKYRSCNHFQAFDSDFMNYLNANAGIANAIEIWGGDCHVSLYSMMRNHQHGIDNSDSGNRRVFIYNEGYTIANTINPITPVKGFSHAIIFPVESNVNPYLREGRRVSRDKAYGEIVNTNGINWPMTGSASPINPEQHKYNDAYSSENGIVVYPGNGIEIRNKGIDYYKSRFKFSKRKRLNEQLNSFRIFLTDAWRELEGQFGQINEMGVKMDRLIAFQEEATSIIPIDEKGMIQASDVSIITLTSADIVGQDQKINDYFGTSHQDSVVEVENGFVFYSARRGAMCHLMMGEGMAKLHVMYGLHSRIANIVGYGAIEEMPLLGKGIHGIYDRRLEEVLMSFSSIMKYDGVNEILDKATLGYDTLNKQFSGIYLFAPKLWMQFKKELFSTRNYDFNSILEIQPFIEYKINDLVRSENTNAIYICIQDYTTSGSPNSPENDSAHWLLVNKIEEIYVHNRGDISMFYGLTHDNGLSIVLNPEIDEAKVFENLEQIGTNGVQWTDITIYNQDQIGVDVDLDIKQNYEYEYRDKKYFSSLPLDNNGNRIEGIYSILSFRKNNAKFENGIRKNWISSNQITRLVKVITVYNKIY